MVEIIKFIFEKSYSNSISLKVWGVSLLKSESSNKQKAGILESSML